MVKEMTFKDMCDDSLLVATGEALTGAILEVTTAEGNVSVSVWLTDNQKWEMIEFLSR